MSRPPLQPSEITKYVLYLGFVASGDNKFLLCQPLSLWSFIIAASKYNMHFSHPAKIATLFQGELNHQTRVPKETHSLAQGLLSKTRALEN